MKIITEPSVYVIGRQTVDDGELNRFLTDHGIAWESDSDVAAEVLAETAGRTCYMSFAKPRPGGNAAYLHHIKEAGHGCYDAETDVLTLNGWKPWPTVTMGDQLATIDPATRRIEYHVPKRLIRYEYSGRMYRVESKCVDLLVTPDHKMLACLTTTLEGRSKSEYKLISSVELGTRSHSYLKCGEWHGGWWANCPGRDVFALLGFAIGDGYIARDSRRVIRFRLRRERKIAWLRAICSRLAATGFVLTEDAGKDAFYVRLPQGEHENGLISHLFSGIYDADGEKQIPWSNSVFSGASRAGLEGLFEGLMQSDGHEGKTSDSFDTTSPHLPGQFQQLCLHIGVAANLGYTYGPEMRKTSYGDKPLTRIHVVRRSLRPEVNKWANCDGKSYWVDDWHGEVFCAEVPNNTLYVRRNGKPVWSGNSVLEHAVWTLLITGVSRSLSHELIRHRAGVSPSQLSQRYVDESVAEYIEPAIIIGDPELHAIWLDAVRHVHTAYVKLTEVLNAKLADPRAAAAAMLPPNADRTTLRKAARQAARSVLPNATETKLVITANARAIRNMLEQRCSRHAEPEIRQLFGKVWELMVKESPNLFGDYVHMPLPDGTFELSTPFRKV